MNESVTLDQFYLEFQKYVELEAKRWDGNDRKWMMIEKRMRQMDKKIDKLVENVLV